MRTPRLLAAALAFLAGPGGPVLAAGPAGPPGTVPAAWSLFGSGVAQQLQDELADRTDPAASRLREFVIGQLGKNPDVTLPPLVVRLWFRRDGAVTKAEIASLGDPRADSDLRAVLTRHKIGLPPPPGMRQPLILRLRLPQQS